MRATLWSLAVLAVCGGLVRAWFRVLPNYPDALDVLTLLLAVLPIPLLLVLRWNFRGVLAGSILILGSLMVLGKIGRGIYPTPELLREESTAVFYVKEAARCWLIGVVVCLLMFGMKRICLDQVTRYRGRHAAKSSETNKENTR